MSTNKTAIIEKYQHGEEATRALQSRNSGLEFHYTKQHLQEYITPQTSVIEVGCGAGYYAMYYADQCKTYVGVDITPENISIFQKRIAEHGLANVTAQVGDATNLKEFTDNSFDIVLCLGPMYHLPPAERELVFAECHRICKPNGIAAFAYINKIGVYAGGCFHDKFRESYPSEQANHVVLKLSKDDVRPDLFFYTMPEEIAATANQHGFEKLKNLGTDFFIASSVVDAMSEEQFQLLQPLLDQMAAYESCTGMSNHGLLVCRKVSS